MESLKLYYNEYEFNENTIDNIILMQEDNYDCNQWKYYQQTKK